jgi:hypothetical protein
MLTCGRNHGISTEVWTGFKDTNGDVRILRESIDACSGEARYQPRQNLPGGEGKACGTSTNNQDII